MVTFIFDLDGTLADTERYGHRVAFNRAFADAGLNWYWSESLYGELLSVSGGKERIRYYMSRYCPEKAASEKVDELIKELHRLKSLQYRRVLQDGKIPLRPGVKRLLDEAREAGIQSAIATNSSLENATALLETHLEIDQYFELVAAGDIIPKKKPAPDIYNYVLKTLQLSPPEVLVFEDSQHGLQAASDAGLKTVVTANDYTIHQDFSNAVLVLNHLGEPDQPFTVCHREGKPLEGKYFDVAFAKKLISQ